MNLVLLDKAYLCEDCHYIGENSKECDYCKSKSILSLAIVLDRKSSTDAPAGLERAVEKLEKDMK